MRKSLRKGLKRKSEEELKKEIVKALLELKEAIEKKQK